ncbi:hypothetical protein [Lactobacillus sp. PV012]|uniref:hypothetical protein n=1 Tax=Lactobacillus sp. PV012 TaxID=2594494 RepID=UPI00223F64CD|nr:hypothetical protein [Lactobacillus sp. PV012]QNQ82755.1 hypothetical protein FP433_06745 [Lactobacillus sp. PV012]
MKRRSLLMGIGLLTLTGLMNSTTQVKADSLLEGMNSNNTISITKKVFVYNHKESAKVNAKRKALIEAQNELSELQGNIKGNEIVTGGVAGFFKEIAENSSMSQNQKDDATTAYAIVKGALDAPSWYNKDVHLGRANDSTSVKNLYATLPYYDQYNKIRQKNNLNVPKISLADVAVAMMDADYSTHIIDHARHYRANENLAWGGLSDPNALWMSEEEIWNDAVKTKPSLAQYQNDGVGLYQADPALYERVGHYLNLTNPSTSSYGYALNTEIHDTEAWDSDYGDPAFTVDEFKKLVTDYYNKMEKPDQVKVAKTKVNTAKKELAAAQKADKKQKTVKKSKKKVKNKKLVKKAKKKNNKKAKKHVKKARKEKNVRRKK